MFAKPVELMREDDAVSPVIGVILMVAITVILAAVIAAFVLGIGDTDDVAPQTTFDSDFGDEQITLEVVSGDAIEVDDFEIRSATADAWDGDATMTLEDATDSSAEQGDTIGVGESFTIDAFTSDAADYDDGEADIDANLVWVGDGEDVVKNLDGTITGPTT